MADLVSIGSFSGCGGSSLGYKRAGFDVRVAIEIDPIAAETYRLNHPGTLLLQEDIRLIDGRRLLDAAGVGVGELHLWEGSPPCSKFSVSGKRHKGWNKVTPSDSNSVELRNVEDLFFDWIRLLGEMRPMTAVAENVPALAIGIAAGKLAEFKKAIAAHGYTVRMWRLPAERYGLPQRRVRLFLVCVRNDLDQSMLYMPKPTHERVPYGPAIADLAVIPWMPPHGGPLPSEDHAPMLAQSKTAELWRQTVLGDAHPTRFNLKKADPSKACPTITSFDGATLAGGVLYGLEPRRFSIAELKRICGFPDDFTLIGTYKDRVGRLGNAVPPILAKVVGESIAEMLHANLGTRPSSSREAG